MKHQYITLESHPTLKEGIFIRSCFDYDEYYLVGDGIKIMTKKEIKSDLDFGYICERKSIKSSLYEVVDSSMYNYYGGDQCVIRDLKKIILEKYES